MSETTTIDPLIIRITNDIMFLALQHLAEDSDVRAKIIAELEVARDMVINHQTTFNPETVCLIRLVHDGINEIVTSNGVFYVHSKN